MLDKISGLTNIQFAIYISAIVVFIYIYVLLTKQMEHLWKEKLMNTKLKKDFVRTLILLLLYIAFFIVTLLPWLLSKPTIII